MKAYKIDVYEQLVTPIEVNDVLQDCYREIGCDTIETGVRLENGDSIYVDEEGLYNEKHLGWFLFDGKPMRGNGVVIGGNDETGESQDVQTSIDDIRARVEFQFMPTFL